MEEKRKEKAKENRKIATERVNKGVEKAETRLKKADKECVVGESKTEIRETKQGLDARKRENEKGNHKRTKKKLRRKGLRKN